MNNRIVHFFRGMCHLAAGLFLLCVLLASPAQADPLHLRAPLPEQTLSWNIGAGTLASVGAWNLPHFATAFYSRIDFNGIPTTAFLLGASVATKFRIVGKDRGFRLDGYAATGIEWKALPTRGMGAMATLALQGAYQGKKAVVALELLGPFSFQFSPNFVARLPIAGGLWVMFRAGRMWFGLYGSAGLHLVVGEPPERHLQFALVWALSLPKWFPGMRRPKGS